MLSCTSSNKLTRTRGRNQSVPQNLDNRKNGRTLERGIGVEHWATYTTPLMCNLLTWVWCHRLVGHREDWVLGEQRGHKNTFIKIPMGNWEYQQQ